MEIPYRICNYAGAQILFFLYKWPCRKSTIILHYVIILKTHKPFLCHHVLHTLSIIEHLFQASISGTLMERCFNILINRWYLPSSMLLTNIYRNAGGGLGMGTTFWDSSVSFVVACRNSPHSFGTLSSSIISSYRTNDICGLMIFLPPRIVIVMQCPSFFGLW